MSEVQQTLTALGLSDKQVAAYLALLELGSASATSIARRAKLKRSTAYDLLADLFDRGLISLIEEQGKRIYQAKSPRSLLDMLQAQETSLKSILPELGSLFNRAHHRPQVHFRDGLSSFQDLHERLLKVKNKQYYYIGVAEDFIEAVGEHYLREYVQRRIKAGIWSNALRIRFRETEQPFLAGGQDQLRRLRYLSRPPLEDIASLYVFDNTVAVNSTVNEAYCLIIESPELARLIMYMWNMLWNNAEER